MIPGLLKFVEGHPYIEHYLRRRLETDDLELSDDDLIELL
jgi:hypothetical protein